MTDRIVDKRLAELEEMRWAVLKATDMTVRDRILELARLDDRAAFYRANRELIENLEVVADLAAVSFDRDEAA